MLCQLAGCRWPQSKKQSGCLDGQLTHLVYNIRETRRDLIGFQHSRRPDEAYMLAIPGTIVGNLIDGQEIRWFINNPHDVIQPWHARGGVYEREELALITQHFKPDRLFADIGVNVCNHAIFVEKYLPGRKIITFKVNSFAIEMLKINLDLNGCQKVDTSYWVSG